MKNSIIVFLSVVMLSYGQVPKKVKKGVPPPPPMRSIKKIVVDSEPLKIEEPLAFEIISRDTIFYPEATYKKVIKLEYGNYARISNFTTRDTIRLKIGQSIKNYLYTTTESFQNYSVKIAKNQLIFVEDDTKKKYYFTTIFDKQKKIIKLIDNKTKEIYHQTEYIGVAPTMGN